MSEPNTSSRDDGLKPITIDPHKRTSGDLGPNMDNFIQNWEHYKNKLVLFIGAGASVGAVGQDGEPIPTAYYLRNKLWRKFMVKEPAEFDPAQLGLVTLEHAAALVERKCGRAALLDFLFAEFNAPFPLWQHSVLPYLHPRAILTTNYDSLVEKGWALHSSTENLGTLRPYHTAEQLDCSQHTPLFRPHGSLDRRHMAVGDGGLVISQFDYLEILGCRRKMVKSCLSDLDGKCVVFVGYGLQDMDIMAELYNLRNPAEKRTIPWYAVFPRDDQNLREMLSDRLGIRQINGTFLDFMAAADAVLGFVPFAWKHDKIGSIPGIRDYEDCSGGVGKCLSP